MTTTALTTPHAPQDRRHSSIAQVLGLAASLVALALVAAPGASAEVCPNEQLRIEDRSTRLPECRAYEQVSPREKSGGMGDVLSYGLGSQEEQPMQAVPEPAAEGDAVVYEGEQFYQPLTGSFNEYLGRLGAGGWSTTNLTPRGNGDEYALLSASRNLSEFVLAFEPADPSAYRNLYLESSTRGLLSALIPAAGHLRDASEFGYASNGTGSRFRVIAASADYSRIFFAANDALLSGSGALAEELRADVSAEITAGEDENYLYEWHEGALRLVSVLPDGKVARDATLGQLYPRELEGVPDLENVVSTGGSQVFWTDAEDETLYVREDGERTGVVAAGGEFLGATVDGSRVLYAKNEALLEETVATHQVAVIAPSGIVAPEKNQPIGAYDGLVGTGDDGEYVYFVSQAELTSAANARGEAAVAGEYNLYVYEPSQQTHTVRFIAGLEQNDNKPSAQDPPTGTQKLGVWARTVGDRTAEVSPDGEFLAFGSHLPLTGVVNEGPQVFVYGAAANTLGCASCDSSGASNGGTFLHPFFDSFGTHLQRYMLDDGSVFFTTLASLVPEDSNDVRDVYVWSSGAGVQLVSPGDSEDPAVLADVTESGSDVFFTTGQPLVTQDQDEIADLYDARVGGGLPAVTQSEACGTPEACRGSKGAVPVFEAPSSATVGGAGNAAPPVSSPAVATPKRKTAAQLKSEKLAKALKVCRKKPKRKRASCERQARARYGAKTKSKSNKRGS